jgi:hypothetical protein
MQPRCALMDKQPTRGHEGIFEKPPYGDCNCPMGKLSRAHVRQHVFRLPPLQSTTTALKRFRTRARVCGEPPGLWTPIALGM